MRIFYVFLFFLMVFSCADYAEKPNNLINKDKMAEIIADLALVDQTYLVNPKGNMELATRNVFKTHEIKAKDFSDSYEYYAVTKKLNGIMEEAQEILLEKYPESKNLIEAKQKEKEKNKNIPLNVR